MCGNHSAGPGAARAHDAILGLHERIFLAPRASATKEAPDRPGARAQRSACGSTDLDVFPNNYPILTGWPVASSTESHKGSSGESVLRREQAILMGTWVKCPFHWPMMIPVLPAMAACTAFCASWMQ